MNRIGTGGAGEYAGVLQSHKLPAMPEGGGKKGRLQETAAQAEAAAAGFSPASPETAPGRKKAAEEGAAGGLPRRKSAPEEISLTFNRQESFGYIGRERDMQDLDMEKAIDDMKRDKVLQQYQYFVGSSRNLYGAESSDGTVIQKL